MKIIDTATLQRLEELEKRGTKGDWTARIDWWDCAGEGIEAHIDPPGDSNSYFCSFPIPDTKFGHGDDRAPWTEEDAAKKSAAEKKAKDSQEMADARLLAGAANALPLLLDSVKRLKEAFLLAREWIGRDPASAPTTYEGDMARITALVYGDV